MTDYIKSMREKIGHQPLILVGATILVYNKQGKILFQHRTDSKDWGLPGGAMELGESIKQTANRELYEETGLKAKNLELVDVFSGKEFYYKYPNGDETYNVIVLFKTTEVSGDLKVNDNESKELKYLSPDEVPVFEKRAKLILEQLEIIK